MAGTVFLQDQRIRHPDDLDDRACFNGGATLRERPTQERLTRTYRYLAGALTWDSLGYAYHHLGQHQEAIECFRRSVELCRGLGNRYDQTHPLIHLGDTHLATGELEAAAWLLALSILEDLDHPEAAHTRTKLAQLDDSPG